jgi:hypothetical protein
MGLSGAMITHAMRRRCTIRELRVIPPAWE